MLLETKSFKFDDFLLDPQEKVLLREGKLIPITPKAFQLLLELVRNHHHLLTKDDLLKRVWKDSFVEEGNLTFTIRLLRKALDDNSKNPRFIETITKRGYRFIGEVKCVEEVEKTASENSDNLNEKPPVFAHFESESAENQSNKLNQSDQIETLKINSVTENFSRRRNFKLFFIAAAILFGIILAGGWYQFRGKAEKNLPVLSASFVSEKLSTNGKVLHAIISSDGKNIFYTNEFNNKTGIWLRQIESGNNVEIIPPTDDFYIGLALSPDGNFLYFVRRPQGVEAQANIYRVSIFGGVPLKIVDSAQGWIDVSPDDTKISFVRYDNRDVENYSLWIADSRDGKNERKIFSSPKPYRISANKFSPDSRSIAFAFGQSNNAANEFSLMEIEIESGVQKLITNERFFNIKGLSWLSDKGKLLVSASRIPNKHFRIWQIDYFSGKAEPLTKDSETYADLSLDKNAAALLAIQIKENFRLQIVDAENPSDGQFLTNASHAAFAPDGQIVFSSPMSGNSEIWTINASGNGQKQLTNNLSDDTKPIVSADNNSIFFASNRTGEIQVWRMNRDGSNQTPITKKDGGFPLFVSPDNQWIYYHHGISRTLWRVSNSDGAEQIVFDKEAHFFAVSPDNLHFAFSEKQNDETFILIAAIADGKIIKKIKIPSLKSRVPIILWMPDGKNLAFILADNDYLNNAVWRQPLDGSSPKKILDLNNQDFSKVSSFAVSPDGKSFSVIQGNWLHDAVLLYGLK